MGLSSPPRSWSRSRAFRLSTEAGAEALAAHLIVATARREPIFLDRELALEVFSVVCAEPSTLAACLMPDHLHWLVAEPREMSRLAARMKSLTTQRAWRLGRSGRIWQRSFLDRLVRTPAQLEASRAYILANPSRAGLVDGEGSYPFVHPLPTS